MITKRKKFNLSYTFLDFAKEMVLGCSTLYNIVQYISLVILKHIETYYNFIQVYILMVFSLTNKQIFQIYNANK